MQTDIKKILDRLDTFLTNDITNFYGLFQGQLGFIGCFLLHIFTTIFCVAENVAKIWSVSDY